MACDANTLMAQAAANGYYGLDDRSLKIAILQLLCSGGGGGASGGGVTAGAGAPSSVPASGAALYIQTDSVPPGIIWEYYSGTWH